MSIGQNIKRLRMAANITQKQLAEQMEVYGSGSVSQWENGICNPSIENIKRIAEILGVTANEILYDEEEP